MPEAAKPLTAEITESGYSGRRASALAQLDGEHRDRAAVYTFHRKRQRFALSSGADYVQQGEIVVGRGDGELGFAAQGFVVDEWGVVAALEQAAGILLEAHGPSEGINRMLSPGVGVEVVHEVATADNEDAFLAQPGQALADVVVEAGGTSFVDAELNDGDVSLGIDVTEH